MRAFFKVLKIAFLLFFLAIAGLTAAAWFMQDRITELAIEKVSETIKAPLGMRGVSLSLIREFPLATVRFDDLWLGATFETGDSSRFQPIDTLIHFEKLYISVESRPLLDNIFNIKEVEAKGGFVKYYINEKGESCFDFLLKGDSASPDSTTEPTHLALDEFRIKDLTCYYHDEQRKAHARADISDLEGEAFIDSLKTFLAARGELRLSECSYDSTNLYKMQAADLQFNVSYEPDVLFLKEARLEAEGARVDAKGNFEFTDQPEVDLSLSASGLDLAQLARYLPEVEWEKYEVSRISGMLDLQAYIKGSVGDSLLPHYEGAFVLSKGSVQWKNYPFLNDVGISGSITNGQSSNHSTTMIVLDQLQARSGSNRLFVQGSFRDFNRLRYDLRSKLEINLADVKPFVPDSVVRDIRGGVSADIQTKGVLPETFDAHFVDRLLSSTQADLRFKDVDVSLDSLPGIRQFSGHLKYKNHEFELEGVDASIPEYELKLMNNSLKGRVKGTVASIDSMDVELSSCYLSTPEGFVRGTATLQNLKLLTFDLQSNVELDLPKYKKYIPDSVVRSMSGQVKAAIHSRGTLHFDSLAAQIQDALYESSTFDIDLKEVELDMPDTMLNVHRVNGYVSIDPQLVKIKNLTGKYSGIDFAFDTTVVKNLFSTVMRDRPGKLEVEGVWRLSHMDYGRLESFLGSDSVEANKEKEKIRTEEKTTDGPSWDGKYEIKGKLFVSSLKYKKGLIEDISTLLNVKDSSYTLDQLKFRAFNGQMNSAVQITQQRDGKTVINLRNKLDRMDIRKLLYEMENFDQKELTWEKINGLLTTEEFFTRIVMQGDSLIYPEIRMKVDFKLENGGIYNYDKVQALTEVPGIDNMDTLLFKTIDNHLFIFNDTICVPETHIVSNKLEASVLGMQGFSEVFVYHVEVRLRELLFGTSKKRKKERADMESEATKDYKKAKWVMLYTDRKGNMETPKIFPDERNRNQMAVDIRAKNASLNVSFHPKVISFETHVSSFFRPSL